MLPKTYFEIIVIDGKEYEVEVAECAVELKPGNSGVNIPFLSDTSSGGIAPMVEKGSSYTRTSELFQVRYTTRVKAAGNWYQGNRIIRVSAWYKHNGSQVGPTSSSSAYPVGTNWMPGVEAKHSVSDTVHPTAPKTTWHYATRRISS